jgi:hypothetical protein
MTFDQLQDLEDIRQLKSRYFRLMDTQQWEAWSDCFAPDVFARYEGVPRAAADQPLDVECSGRDGLLAGVRGLLTGAVSMHQGFMPEIRLTGAETAEAIWAMFDYVRLPTCHFKGWGHYHEQYRRQAGAWRIQRIHLTRLHTEETWV